MESRAIGLARAASAPGASTGGPQRDFKAALHELKYCGVKLQVAGIDGLNQKSLIKKILRVRRPTLNAVSATAITVIAACTDRSRPSPPRQGTGHVLGLTTGPCAHFAHRVLDITARRRPRHAMAFTRGRRHGGRTAAASGCSLPAEWCRSKCVRTNVVASARNLPMATSTCAPPPR